MLPARSHFDIVAIEILGRVSSFFPPLHRRIFFLLKKKKFIYLAALGFSAVSQVIDL